MDRIEVTWKKYYIDSTLSKQCISDITEQTIIEFIIGTTTEHGAVSKKEMERIMQIIRGILEYMRDRNTKGVRLYDWKMIKRNIPRENIITHKKDESALSKSTVATFIYAVMATNIYPDKRCAALVLCMNFYLGLRIGELAALKFTDFDLAKKILHITRSDTKEYERDENGNKVRLAYNNSEGKTSNARRNIPLLPEAVYIYELIQMHHKTCGYNSAFLVYDGTDTIRVRSLDRTLRRVCALTNIHPFNSHIIRKTFASMLHHSNVPTRVIADLMGHADISTTERNYILSFKDNYDTYYKAMKGSLKYN